MGRIKIFGGTVSDQDDVFCTMVHDEIPRGLCAEEQGGRACYGCRAPTRRCTTCKGANGIAEPKMGLCAECYANLAFTSNELSTHPAGIIEGGLEAAVEQLRTLGDIEIPTIAPPGSGGLERQEAYSDPQIRLNPGQLFSILCEHCIERPNGAKVIPAPVTVLQIRARLDESQAVDALRVLAEQGLLALADDVSDARILAAELPAFPPYITNPTDRTRTPPPSPKPPRIPRVIPAAGPMRAVGKTVGDVYTEYLLPRASKGGGERIVRGALPILQLALRVGPLDAQRILEQLLEAGHIEQRDGWRSIVLKSDRVEDATIAVSPAVTSPRQSGAIALPQRNAAQSPRRDTTSSQTPTRSIPRSGDPVDAAIAHLEGALPQLRELRDRVNMQVAQLEATYMALTMLRGQYADATGSAGELLRKVETDVKELLATLRAGVSQ